MEQRFTFDQITDVYKATRPDYPEALMDDVLSYADLKQNDNILEVGCGTGQATKSFAKRDFPIIAIDPGSELLRGARENLSGFGNVEFLETTFEARPTNQGGFRMIISTQAWHWVSPEVRLAKGAEALSSDGSLAVFGHVPVGLPASFLAQFKEIYLRQTGYWGRPPEAWSNHRGRPRALSASSTAARKGRASSSQAIRRMKSRSGSSWVSTIDQTALDVVHVYRHPLLHRP